MLDQINEALKYLQSQTEVKPQVGVILGTGLGGLVDEINIINQISYEDIPISLFQPLKDIVED